MDGGSNYKKQKDYQNIVNPSLINDPADKKVLDLLNIPSLHILIGKIFASHDILVYLSICLKIGVVDKHIKELEKSVFSTPEEGEQFMDSYLKQVLISGNFVVLIQQFRTQLSAKRSRASLALKVTSPEIF